MEAGPRRNGACAPGGQAGDPGDEQDAGHKALVHCITNHLEIKLTKSGADLAIAAIAISRQMIVATGNVDHFNEINVSFPLAGVCNPLNGTWAAAAGR
jgi:hypothetical protein